MSTADARIAGLESDLRSQIHDELDDLDRELAAVADAIAAIRDAAERIDRALTAYDTLPGDTEPAPTVPEHEDPARLRGQLADAHADCARYAAERDEARAERDEYARRLRAIDTDPRPTTMLRYVPFDCGTEGDDDWGVRYGAALDAAATAQQLRDDIAGGAQ